jgi:ubiquinone/menaquinone biosynthesis C-methylase UbiE
MSTRSLATCFHDAELIYGIDTSPEMISVARFITKFNAIIVEIKKVLSPGAKFVSHCSIIKLVTKMKNIFSLHCPSCSYNCMYAIGNAERVLAPKCQFDLITIFFAFHEIPFSARYRIMRESRRLLKPGGKLAIIDICPNNYVPSESMLSGEPYVLEYQKNIENQIEKIQGFHKNTKKRMEVIPGHVVMWIMTRRT